MAAIPRPPRAVRLSPHAVCTVHGLNSVCVRARMRARVRVCARVCACVRARVPVPVRASVRERVCQVEGVLRTKPGRGERTACMSCSDKIARWNALGLQGGLLADICGPMWLRWFNREPAPPTLGVVRLGSLAAREASPTTLLLRL